MIMMRWDGHNLVPISKRWQEDADKKLVVGQLYPVTVEMQRSSKEHKFYFAAIKDAWANLREDIAATMPSPEHLRKWALIQAGYCTMTKLAFKTNAEAIAACAFIATLDTYAECGVNGNVAVIRRATSQSVKAMGKKEFQVSKGKVLDVISQLIGAEVKEAA